MECWFPIAHWLTWWMKWMRGAWRNVHRSVQFEPSWLKFNVYYFTWLCQLVWVWVWVWVHSQIQLWYSLLSQLSQLSAHIDWMPHTGWSDCFAISSWCNQSSYGQSINKSEVQLDYNGLPLKVKRNGLNQGRNQLNQNQQLLLLQKESQSETVVSVRDSLRQRQRQREGAW